MKDVRLARLLRPCAPSDFPPNIVATYDKEHNIVRYNKEVFDTLSPMDQSKVRNLTDKYLELATAEPAYFNK